MTTTQMKASEVLRKAQKSINKPRKWCQGRSHRARFGLFNQYCMVAAVGNAAHRLTTLEGCEAFAKALQCLEQSVLETPQWWNDKPSRTHPEVMAAFDKAIALAEQEEANASPPQ